MQHQNGLLDTEVFTADQATMNLALTEGDATRIERVWFDQMSPEAQLDMRLAYEALAPGVDQSATPNSYFETTFAIPHVLGESIVEMLLASGGLEAMNEAMRDPNLTTERMIDPLTTSPRSMFKGNRYSLVTAPDQAEVGSRSVLGPSTLYLTFAPGLGAADTIDALTSYEADIYEFWSADGMSCIDLHIWFDTTSNVDEFVALASPLYPGALRSVDASTGENRADLRLCGDSVVGGPQAQTPSLLKPLVSYHALLADLHSQGVDGATASCAALGVIRSVPLDHYSDVDADELYTWASELSVSAECVSQP